MKHPLVVALALHAIGFTATALAHSAGDTSIDVLTPIGVAGFLIVAAMLAFACADYRRRPSFRVRRSRQPDSFTSAPLAALPPLDWTYHTRSNWHAMARLVRRAIVGTYPRMCLP